MGVGKLRYANPKKKRTNSISIIKNKFETNIWDFGHKLVIFNVHNNCRFVYKNGFNSEVGNTLKFPALIIF